VRDGKQPLFDSSIKVIKSASLADLVAKIKVGRFDGDDSSNEGKQDYTCVKCQKQKSETGVKTANVTVL
jgi:hypothetical protein